MPVFDLLHPKLKDLAKKRFKEPTNIQKKAIPEILSGENVLVVAGTGLGKTEAVMLPIFNKIYENQLKKISALYITPLRSLNRDMFERLFWWSDKLDLEIAIRHGDTSQKERIEQREIPSHILITTPETLQAILTGKKMKKHLSNIKYVVIDEIHELVSSKRGIQLSLALERLKQMSGKFQIIGLSATIGSEKDVASFIGNAKIVKTGDEREIKITIKLPIPKIGDEKLEDELLADSYCIARLKEISNLVKSNNSVLIFTNTRHTAEMLSSRLRILDKNIKQEVHHGSLSKDVRIKSEKMFKSQKLKALIATSSLELGIDIGSVDVVVQYLSPRQVTKLAQRVGRSGHNIYKKAVGILLTNKEDAFESAVINKHLKENKIERTKIRKNALDVLAHQIVGLSIDKYRIKIDEAYDIIKNSWAYRSLTKNKFDEVLSFLSGSNILFIDYANMEIIRRRKAWQYYFENLSTISETGKYIVVNKITNEPIGTLDENFVIEHCETGNSFICKGVAWKVVEKEKKKVMVEPSDDADSPIPSWEGEMIPVSLEVAKDVGKLRRCIDNFDEKMQKEYGVDDSSLKEMKKIIRNQKKKYIIPDDKNILIEDYRDFIIIHSCFGSMVNDTIGRYISTTLNLKYGIASQMKTNPYSIILKTAVNPNDVKKIIENAGNIKNILTRSVETSSLFKLKFIQVAKRFGAISHETYLDKININKIISFYKNTPIYEEVMNEIFFEKLDLRSTEKILNEIKNKKIKIVCKSGLSPLGKQNLIYQFGEPIAPKVPIGDVFEVFKKRLLNTMVTLVCMNCGKYYITKRVSDIKEVECPICGSSLIGVTNKISHKLLSSIRNKLDNKKIGIDENKELAKIRRTANLIIAYGYRAVLALSGCGIEPESAARILAKRPKNEEELLKCIFESEKNIKMDVYQ
ncbi:MAG: DEAD/DEAH box helicase [Candidatus Aenigmarchaeota archaeon]|nr:DEAD/DEAH box helicase [Candidatus Aenigmarchaeota archaeon]